MAHGFRGGGGSRGRGRGRGAYYANRYGRGRGRGSSDSGGGSRSRADPTAFSNKGGCAELEAFLQQMNNGPYPRYRDLIGEWDLLNGVSFFIDRVQADPYAPPSRARVRVKLSETGFAPELYLSQVRAVAFCDYLTRKFWRAVHAEAMDVGRSGGGWSGSKGGDLNVDCPGQHVLQRTSCLIVDGLFIELRFTVNLPARGRSIEGYSAANILTKQLPEVLREVVFARQNDSQKLFEHVISVEDQEYLREVKLKELGLIAFIINGALLPRSSGAEDGPMNSSTAVKFESPEGLAVEVELPSGKRIRGMGIKPGIALIVGGGFHGKSTLLSALEVGVYNHIPGDGREFVCVDPSTVSIRAEDGRSVTGVNITPFINNLPFGKPTSCFSTPDASGSTSQAASIIEALEAGAKVLLTDEDLAATNFMIRDKRMQELVPSAKEPITPMIQRIRALYEEEGVSSILVVGGSGDYFEVSDLVVMMDCYKPRDVTEAAKGIATRFPSVLNLKDSSHGIFKSRRKRRLASSSIQQLKNAGKGRCYAKVKGTIEFGNTELDVSAVSQIVEVSQTRAIASALEKIGGMSALDEEGPTACVNELMDLVKEKGLDAVSTRDERLGNYAWPRPMELQSALNRLRGVTVLEARP